MISQFFGGGERQLAHAQVVDDEQRHGLQELHMLFARAVERGFGKTSSRVSIWPAGGQVIAVTDRRRYWTRKMDSG